MTPFLKIDRLYPMAGHQAHRESGRWIDSAGISLGRFGRFLLRALAAIPASLSRPAPPSTDALGRHMLNDIGFAADDPSWFSVDEVRRRTTHM